MRIVIAPTGFKECLDADAVATAIERGVHRTLPHAVTDTVPLVDGGEGSARLLANGTGGRLVSVEVTGPVGAPAPSHFAMLGGTHRGTAFVEMAAAAGLGLVPADRRDPGTTTSRGVGELIAAALDAGARSIIVGCGDSGVCDGGAGALQALGVNVRDETGAEIGDGGTEVARARSLDVTGLDARLAEVDIVVAANPANKLCGPRGVAHVFGPQKGASPEQVEELASAMRNWAALLPHGDDLGLAPGGGASGGLGAGLAGVLGARLASRFDVLLDTGDLDHRLADADLVITAEGAIDASTAGGKVPAEVARRAKEHGKPVIALAGTIGAGADTSYATGIDAFVGIVDGPVALAEAITEAPELLATATARALRMLTVGQSLAG